MTVYWQEPWQTQTVATNMTGYPGIQRDEYAYTATIRGRLYDRIVRCWSTRVNDKIKPEKENERYVKKRRKTNCKQKPKLIHYYKAHKIWHCTPLRTRCLCVCIRMRTILHSTVQCAAAVPGGGKQKNKTHTTNACVFYRTATATPSPLLRCSTEGDGDRQGTTAKVHLTSGLRVCDVINRIGESLSRYWW